MSPNILQLRRRTDSVGESMLFGEEQPPYASFVNFDGPDRSACHQTEPNQYPFAGTHLLNDQAYVEMALGFAVSILEKTQGQSEKERITHAVRRALSRDPSDREINVLLGLLNEQRERLKSDSSIGKSLLSPGSPD